MELPAERVPELVEILEFVSGTGQDDHGLGAALESLVMAVRAGIASYRGMRVTVIADGQAVHLDAFVAPGDQAPAAADVDRVDQARSSERIMTSLRLPLSALLPPMDDKTAPVAPGRVVFYASVPGAFVDLAADLEYTLNKPATDPAQSSELQSARSDGLVELDADLPPPSQRSGVTGLQETSAINRALGMLIAEGYLPDQAYRTLSDRAAAAGVELHVYAGQLLGRRTPD